MITNMKLINTQRRALLRRLSFLYIKVIPDKEVKNIEKTLLFMQNYDKLPTGVILYDVLHSPDAIACKIWCLHEEICAIAKIPRI